MRSTLAVLSLAAAVVLAGCAAAPRARTGFAAASQMVDGPMVAAPDGYRRMCAADAALCAAAVDSGQRPAMSPAFRALLDGVNRRVNGGVRPVTDAAAFGRAELWRRSGMGKGAQGDCEDYAIEKREQLIAAGVPADALFFAVAYRRDIGLHTMLVVRTGSGDVVLDNRTPYIQNWHDVPYQWVSRQHATNPMHWTMVFARPQAQQVAMLDPIEVAAGQ